jgi:glycosyltransferase involved in cell wall biosynthesis
MPCRIDASEPLVYQTWMVNPDPKVTVVMAAYNWSAVLPYSIGSVLAQTCTDFELWVVGDACTDDSEQVVASIQDPRVHWCNLATNVGQQGGPNNEGIRRARGQYIAYLGHDDLWLPHHLESLVSVMESGADVAWGVVSLLLENQKGVLMPHEPQKYRPGMWIPPTGIMHRKDLAQKVGGWRLYDEITMDPETDLLLRMHEAGGEFRFAPRLTALKFPAARRKNVYSDKPCHEQAVWSQKMKEGADLERDQLLKIAANPFGTAAILVGLWLRAKVDVCSEFLLGYKKGVFNRRRKFKGLAPKS